MCYNLKLRGGFKLNQNGRFYGWWISIACFFTFGLAVGIPYYGMPFFYDYYQKTFGWEKSDIVFGFPLAAACMIWFGPLVIPKFSTRKMIMAGTGLTALAFLGFGTMGKSIFIYWGFWLLYMAGYILSGPIPHQILISQWFRRNRGKAMAATYLGVGFFGGISSKFIAKPLTEAFGFQTALLVIGGLMFLAWPLALFIMKDRPVDIGQFPDGDPEASADSKVVPQSFSSLLHQPSFWLLMMGSLCSIGAIGSINQNMKFVFKEQGFVEQKTLDELFSNATMMILFSSIAGRIVMGYLADIFPKKWVMLATYALVAGTIPLLQMVRPTQPEYVYFFSILFGFGMGADYMLIPLMAAEQFGVNSLGRAMAIILPADTIGQTWFPFVIAKIRESFGGYQTALNVVFALAFVGAVAIALLPNRKRKDETLPLQEPGAVTANR